MTFPGLPFDRLPKFIFIGSLALLALMFSILWQNDKTYEKENDDVKQKKMILLYKMKCDSLDFIYAVQALKEDSVKFYDTTLSPESKQVVTEVLKADLKIYLKHRIELVRMGDEMKYLTDRLENIRKSQEGDQNFIYGEAIVFIVILFIGLMFWIREESITIETTNRKINIETKNIACQSCGMILKYDLHPHIEAELCNTCYDGEKYREPDLTFEEMSKRVKGKLKEIGLTDKQIKKELISLSKLNRWEKALRW